MTWGATILSGSGKLSFRFHIEGCVYDWVTDANMEAAATTGASAKAARKKGLKRDGLTFSDEAMPLDGKVKCTGPTIRIADIDGAATYAFTFQGDDPTWLTATVTDAATALTVISNTGYAPGDIIHINTEAMYVTSVSGGTTINVNRGVYGTTAQYHYTNDQLPRALFPEVTQVPISLEGRRCRLYAYGEGDSPTGDGTAVWHGVVLSDPESSDGGVYWEIATGGLDRLLDQEMGLPQALQAQPRGIYYPAARPFYLVLSQSSTAAYDGTWTDADPIVMMGFWETQTEFIADLNVEIQTVIDAAGFVPSIFAREVDDQSWQLVVRQTASARAINYQLVSPCDIKAKDGFDGIYLWLFTDMVNSEEYTATILSGSVRSGAFEYFGNARGTWGSDYYPGSPGWPGNDPALEGTYPMFKIYVAGDLSEYATIGTGAVTIRYSGTHAGAEFSYVNQWDVSQVTLNTSENSIVFNGAPSTFAGPMRAWGRFSRPANAFSGGAAEVMDNMCETTIVPADVVDSTVTDIGGLIDAINTRSAQWCNAGMSPLIADTEWSTSTTSNEIAAAIAGKPYGQRSYGILPRKKLSDILAEELKLIGCYLCIGASGKLTVRRLMSPSFAAVTGGFTLEASTTEVKQGIPTWQRNAYGMVGAVMIQDEYNDVKGEHEGDELTIIDAASNSTVRTARRMKITPYSQPAGLSLTLNDALDIGATYFSIFSYPYANITANATLASFTTAYAGKAATVQSKYLFDVDSGVRWSASSVARAALILGRKLDIAKGFMALKMLMPLGRNAGYVPAGYVAAASGAGTAWTLTLQSADPVVGVDIYAEDGATVDYFAIGDQVLLCEYDVSSSSTYSGEVTAVSGDDVTITFDGAWGGIAGSSWYLTQDIATDADLQAPQRKFCYVANSSARVAFSAGEQAAKVFGG